MSCLISIFSRATVTRCLVNPIIEPERTSKKPGRVPGMPLLLPTAVPTPTTSCWLSGLWLGDEIMPSRGVKHLEWPPRNYRAGALRCTAPSCSFRSAGVEGFTRARTAIKKETIRQMVHSGASAASFLCSLSLPRERLPRKLESKLHPDKTPARCPLESLGQQ